MKIAILSDIHDNVWNLRAALNGLAGLSGDEAVQQIICCGDLCSPFVAGMLVEHGKRHSTPVHIVFGNNDGDTSRITAQAKGWDGLRVYNEFAELALHGSDLIPLASATDVPFNDRIAVQHYDTIARPLAQSGQYRLVCFGHNHRCELTCYGEQHTLALNPGALMGFAPSLPGPVKDITPTYAIYDSETHTASFYEVLEPWQSPEAPGSVRICPQG